MLCYIKGTKSFALLFSFLLLVFAAYFIAQSTDVFQQSLIAICFGLWLLVAIGFYRMATPVDRFRILKG